MLRRNRGRAGPLQQAVANPRGLPAFPAPHTPDRLRFTKPGQEPLVHRPVYQFEANVFGLFDVTRAALPLLRAQGSGHILMISSVAGQVGAPGLGIYGASKFAVEGFSEALAQEVAPFNIKVTLIEPGTFRTDWAGRSMPQAEPMEAYQQTAGYVRGALAQFNGQQPGAPARAAQAMLQVVEAAEPPLRLPLGGDAVSAIRQKIERQLEELSQCQVLSTSTNFGA